MSEKLKIKLSIADRVYPLTIPVQQEEGLRKAAKEIDARSKIYKVNHNAFFSGNDCLSFRPYYPSVGCDQLPL